MGLIFQLSLRNLLRQKRRNFLLGICIGFGMMVLVIANSFSHGIVEVLIDNVVSNVFGHLVITSHINNNNFSIFRDKARIDKIVRDTIEKRDLIGIRENAGFFAQAVGNKATDNVIVAGFTPATEKEKKQFFEDFFTLVAGNFSDYYSSHIEYPVLISQQKAESLNVKIHDVIYVRLVMITGQIQTAKLTVVAIANAKISFMDMYLFMDCVRVKRLLGYKQWEAAGLQILLNHPKETVRKYADILHQNLTPGIIAIIGRIDHEECRIFAFKNDKTAKELLQKYIHIIRGNINEGFNMEGVMLSLQLAEKLRLNIGDEFVYQYQTKFRGLYRETFRVSAIYDSKTKLNGNIVLVNGEKIFNIYDRFLPAHTDTELITESDPYYSAFATEWKLLGRSQDSEALEIKNKQERKIKTDQSKVDIITMYEGASDIISLERVFNILTAGFILILFFITLIGVMNTLRTTIKERTREIGTVRSIGMQRKDVRNMFILEILLLAAISCIAGIIMAFLIMEVLGHIQLNVHNAFGVILKGKRLHFKLNWLGILLYYIFIMLISGVTVYFPAKRAARLSIAEALRHYE